MGEEWHFVFSLSKEVIFITERTLEFDSLMS